MKFCNCLKYVLSIELTTILCQLLPFLLPHPWHRGSMKQVNPTRITSLQTTPTDTHHSSST